MRHISVLLVILSTASLLGCSLIDDNQSDCGKDLGVDYELQLVTNVSTELQAKLGMSTDVALSATMRSHLDKVFTDHADDVDLSFYDITGDSLRLHHEQHQMDASRSSYTLYIPVREYMHLAVANVMENGPVQLRGDDSCHSAMLMQEEADTIDSQRTGLFTARRAMDILDGIDQQFDVHLYMANCAIALVLDTTGIKTKDVRVLATGFATSFSIADSIYHYRPGTMVRTENVTTSPDDGDNINEMCFTAVSFPTRDVRVDSEQTKVIIETDDFVEEEYGTEPIWELHVFVTLEDNTVTRTLLKIYRSVRAGQITILKGRLKDDGSAMAEDPTVGVSVSLDWHEGGSYDVPL